MPSHIDICSIAFSAEACWAGFRAGAGAPMYRGMEGGSEFEHRCSFCGWARASATPVMLSPCCDRCGCALEAGLAAAEPVPVLVGWSMPPAFLFVLRAAATLLAALALYAAAKLGYEEAGASGAMVAFGVGGFLMLPFVPARVGAPAAHG
jgi:hypothetical protein